MIASRVARAIATACMRYKPKSTLNGGRGVFGRKDPPIHRPILGRKSIFILERKSKNTARAPQCESQIGKVRARILAGLRVLACTVVWPAKGPRVGFGPKQHLQRICRCLKRRQPFRHFSKNTANFTCVSCNNNTDAGALPGFPVGTLRSPFFVAWAFRVVRPASCQRQPI